MPPRRPSATTPCARSHTATPCGNAHGTPASGRILSTSYGWHEKGRRAESHQHGGNSPHSGGRSSGTPRQPTVTPPRGVTRPSHSAGLPPLGRHVLRPWVGLSALSRVIRALQCRCMSSALRAGSLRASSVLARQVRGDTSSYAPNASRLMPAEQRAPDKYAIGRRLPGCQVRGVSSKTAWSPGHSSRTSPGMPARIGWLTPSG